MNAAKDCTLQEKLLRCAMALILAAGALLASVAASPAYAAPSTVATSICMERFIFITVCLL